MRYLLDSHIISDFYNPSALHHQKIIEKILKLMQSEELFISILTIYEFEYAAINAPDQQQNTIRLTIQRIKNDFTILSLSLTAAKIFAMLKQSIKLSRNLNAENLKKHNIDLMIAATAIEKQAILVSSDGLFSEILKINFSIKSIKLKFNIENWLA